MTATATWLVASAAFAAGWQVQTLTTPGNAESKFPWVVGPDSAAADRINGVLFLDVLGLAPPRERPSTFTLPGDKERPAPVMPDRFEILRSDGRVLSLLVGGETCGAYCEGFDTPFLFDLATGHRVTNAELLTPQGRSALVRKGLQGFIAAIGAQLATLDKPARAKGSDDLSDGDRKTMRLIYRECRDLQRAAAKAGRLVGSLSVGGKGGAELTFQRCTPHAMLALDEIGEFTYRVPADELARSLTAYGRALLLGEGMAAAGSSPIGQTLTGSVGSAAIRLYTGTIEDDASFGGTYYYDRYRKPISLTGRFDGELWTMSESSDAGDARGEWLLHRDGKGWTGTWTGADGRRLPVRLVP